MHRTLTTAAVAIVAVVVGMPAHGTSCYQIWDKRDVLMYQSTLPPFALSSPDFERSMNGLRAQTSALVYFDAVACPDEGSHALAARERAAKDSASQPPGRATSPRRRGIPSSGPGTSR